MKIDILVKFCTLFSFRLRFQWVVNGSGGQNPLRAQSKYGLMGSSAKTGKKFFKGHQSTFWIKIPFGIGCPPPTHQLQSTCVGGRVQGSQIFKQISIISIHSKVMAFLVILLSPWSPCCPCGPHVIPVIPKSSPCHPRCPHIIPIASRRSPCGPHGCGPRCLRSLHPMLSPSSPHGPHHPHVIPVIPMLSPYRLCHPHIIPIAPRRSPCGPHGCCLCGLHCFHGLHPMLFLSSQHCPRCLQIIPNPPDTHSTHPPPPRGWGTPNQ